MQPLPPEQTGGCQCGAIRYRFARAVHTSICHCRMCQKAVGNMFAAFVHVTGFALTRGTPARFDSSNMNFRRFCADCGTPLTYEREDYVSLTLGSLDRPDLAHPERQVEDSEKHPGFDALRDLPGLPDDIIPRADAWKAQVVSNQHPDHDT